MKCNQITENALTYIMHIQTPLPSNLSSQMYETGMEKLSPPPTPIRPKHSYFEWRADRGLLVAIGREYFACYAKINPSENFEKPQLTEIIHHQTFLNLWFVKINLCEIQFFTWQKFVHLWCMYIIYRSLVDCCWILQLQASLLST